ncbi:MAG: 3-methyl-2-oxobutanoate hydroxymethyltransferase, partial [Planctomycetota bacterium]
MSKKLTVEAIREWKLTSRKKLMMITAYDALDARYAAQDGIDILLVGDSLGGVKLGLPDVKDVTPDMMAYHTEAVRRGVPDAFVSTDVSYLSMVKDDEGLIADCRRFMSAGADSVKIESDLYSANRLAAVVSAGVPVIGHLGYTPQSANKIGVSTVQGRTADKAIALLKTADALEAAGCFCLLCELIPGRVGEAIAKRSKLPVVGIGAGPDVDGHVLVLHDLAGLSGHEFKFSKVFSDAGVALSNAVKGYVSEVQSGEFPSESHTF